MTDEVFIKKRIRNCLQQYHCDSLPEAEYTSLIHRIRLICKEQPDTDLHDVVEDLVYEYLTK